VPILTSHSHFLLFDSDLLFFRKPVEILSWCKTTPEECWFNRDVQESCSVPEKIARELFGIDLWPKVQLRRQFAIQRSNRFRALRAHPARDRCPPLPRMVDRTNVDRSLRIQIWKRGAASRNLRSILNKQIEAGYSDAPLCRRSAAALLWRRYKPAEKGTLHMKVLFAPDYRAGVAYQELLARALDRNGVSVEFLAGYRRVFPLYRSMRSWQGDILHLHWPEKYFERRNDAGDLFRKLRYPLDLSLALRRVKLVVTAHDLYPHNRFGEPLVSGNIQRTYDCASRIIAHSDAALDALCETYRIDRSKCAAIRHGDLSRSFGMLPDFDESRTALGIPSEEKLCLIFGTVEPYKGLEPVIDYWPRARPSVTLVILGKPFSREYERSIRSLAGGAAGVRLELGWQSEDKLHQWLAAANCVLFNYRFILTSGAASLARSLGIPMLIPKRLSTIDLIEPHPLVFRFTDFESDFSDLLQRAAAHERDANAAAAFREESGWEKIAAKTVDVYRAVLNA
jgi:beta-1,4-mannosyltransferase